MDNKLTERQEMVYSAIKTLINTNTIPPTRLELSKKLGFKSPYSLDKHLKSLVKKGYIRNNGEPRGLFIVDRTQKTMQTYNNFYELPIIGKVAAGFPIEAKENIEKIMFINSSMFDVKPDYLLRVTGDSMINVGIMDGDLIAVQKSKIARNGQIVIARVNGSDVTVKRYKKEGSMVWLIPENDGMQPIKVDLEYDRLDIDGIYVGLLRASA